MISNPYGESNLGFALDVILIEPAGQEEKENDDRYEEENLLETNDCNVHQRTYQIASSDFIVQFPNPSHSHRHYPPAKNGSKSHKDNDSSNYYHYSITLQINGNNLNSTALQMVLDPTTGLCKFQQGQSFRPETSALQQLIQEKMILPGRNFIRYILHQHWKGKDGTESSNIIIGTSEAYLYLWSVHDRIIISDVDGTVTRSDVRGVIDSILTENYSHIHEGVCQLFHDIVEQGKRHPLLRGQIRMLYLSSRPLKLIHSTRKFLSTMNQSSTTSTSCSTCLPAGPIFLQIGNLSKVLVTDLIHKSTHEFKADTLTRQVVIPFIAAGKKDCVFLAGFGNKKTDYLSYRMVGLESRDIYIINKKSVLTSARNEEIQENQHMSVVDTTKQVAPMVSERRVMGRSKSGTLLCFDDLDSSFNIDVDCCCGLDAIEVTMEDCTTATTMSSNSSGGGREDVLPTVVMSSSAIKIYTDPQVVMEHDASITSSMKFIGYSDPRLKKELLQKIYSS